MLFNELGLSADLLRAVEEQGYETPTPIQREAIPHILEGHDILAGAQTGTGKTAGFTLPMLQILGDPLRRPTSSACADPDAHARACRAGQRERSHLRQVPPGAAMEIYGGVSPRPQITKINRASMLSSQHPVACSIMSGRETSISRRRDVCSRRSGPHARHGLHPRHQADHQALPKERQNLLFSATFSKEIRELANNLLDNPAEIQVAARNTTADRVEQLVYPVDKARKRELLSEMIGRGNWQQVLVFTRTKHGANRLAKQLNQDGITSDAIHGNKGQGARTKALRDFKAGKSRVLVATDIAARGLDIQKLPHVVNFELPHVPEDYVHRIGRTARAGQDGTAVSLVCIDEQKLLKDIEQLLKRDLKKEFVPGYEVDKRIRAEPLQKGRPQQRKPRNAGSPSRPSGRKRPGKNARNNQRKRSGTAARPRAS